MTVTEQFWDEYTALARQEHKEHRRLGDRYAVHDRITGHLMECGLPRGQAIDVVVSYEHQHQNLGYTRGRMQGMLDMLKLFTGLSEDEVLDRAEGYLANIDEY